MNRMSISMMRLCQRIIVQRNTQAIQLNCRCVTPALKLTRTLCHTQDTPSLLLRTRVSYPTHFQQQRASHDNSDDGDGCDKDIVKTVSVHQLATGIMQTFRNIIKFIYFKNVLDRSFKLEEFIVGARVAICYVSSCLAEGKLDLLQNVISTDALLTAVVTVENSSGEKKQLLNIKPDDIFHFGILDIGIIEDKEKRFVEITTVACAKDKENRVYPESLKHIKGEGPQMISHVIKLIKSQDSVLLVTCRFIREYTRGVSDDWTVNKLSHIFVMPDKE